MTDDTSGGGDDGLPFDAMDRGSRTLDDAVVLLANAHTRYVLWYLEPASTDIVEIDDLVEHVLARESEASEPGTESRDDRRQRVAATLHHVRLPELDDEAIIDYDPRSNTVRYWGDDRVAALLEVFASAD